MAPATTLARASWPERLKDAALASFMALLLGIPFIGLTTVDAGGRLMVQTRWDWLTITAVAVFPGRLLVRWLLQFRQAPSAVALTATASASARGQRWLRFCGGLAFALAVAVPILFYDNRYVVDTATTVLIYVLLGWGLNVVVGLAGLLDLGYVAFYAAGAYTYAVLATEFGLSFWLCLPLAMAIAAALGIVLGYPVLRLRGDYLAIVTLGFGEIIRLILLNWTTLTGGPNGIASIPRPTLFGLAFSPASAATPTFARFFDLPFASWHRTVFLYALILALALAANWLILRLRNLPIGRAWEAMREDEIAARALGLNVTNVKLSAFAIGATLGGLAGVFFAARQGFVSPESFTFVESAIILSIVVLGGSGSQLGVVLAASVLVLLPEIGRNFSEYRMMVFGAAMVAIMVWRPGGLLSTRRATVLSQAGKA